MHSHAIDLDRARDQLPRLIEQAAQGDEVILTEAGEPVARITPFVPARKPRQFGSARGMIQMADDFDARSTTSRITCERNARASAARHPYPALVP